MISVPKVESRFLRFGLAIVESSPDTEGVFVDGVLGVVELDGVLGTVLGVVELDDVFGVLGTVLGVVELDDVFGVLGTVLGVVELDGVLGTVLGVVELDGVLGNILDFETPCFISKELLSIPV